jgi:hypothetical protein
MVAMAELGEFPEAKIKQSREMRIYKRIWKEEGDESNIAKIAKYTYSKWGREAYVCENRYITSALKQDKQFAKEHTAFLGDMQAGGVTTFSQTGMVEDMFKDGARVMLAVAFYNSKKKIKLHFLLARKENGQIWVMNPDGGLDRAVSNFSSWVNRPESIYKDPKKTEYIFTGVYVVLR